jgi:hypothetical protein
MKDRRTEMMCTAMNSLFRTRTLASSADEWADECLPIMEPPVTSIAGEHLPAIPSLR